MQPREVNASGQSSSWSTHSALSFNHHPRQFPTAYRHMPAASFNLTGAKRHRGDEDPPIISALTLEISQKHKRQAARL
jgi:hypothetical protein